MTAIISKWGNSQGLRFPKDLMNDLDLSVGDKVKISTENHKVIIEPLKEKRKIYDINDLVAQIPSDYEAHEEFNEKIGIEEW
ncbi:MAG: AbrB/MazE/SpoVT family DNA-binding domain-containing protein [Campylobacterota bacterium]|nr:AbrB/MazE/SpoVT family DNA-binding domain-containing protein [Campylobacterota bacterium]